MPEKRVIGKKIKSWSIKEKEKKEVISPQIPKATNPKIEVTMPKQPEIVVLTEKLGRPKELRGATYKLKPPASDHAYYVTINDIVLNPGTAHEQQRPFEIFINTKDTTNLQWVTALTRVTSAVFRKGGDVSFLVEEFKSIFDPKGGYFQPGGLWCSSLVYEIGGVIEKHMEKARAGTRARQEQSMEQATGKQGVEKESPGAKGTQVRGEYCSQCHNYTMILMDGCRTCLSCGHGHCG